MPEVNTPMIRAERLSEEALGIKLASMIRSLLIGMTRCDFCISDLDFSR